MEGMSPELINTLFDIGGTPALVGLIVWKMWNGSTKRITEISTDTKSINEKVDGIDRRLVRLETRFEDSGKRRRASDVNHPDREG